MKIDIQLAQWLCSRLCHDMASGVGAVMAGLEMYNDDGGTDALKLAENSAEMLSEKLQFLRMAFGYGAGVAPVDMDKIKQLVDAQLSAGRVRMHWQQSADGGAVSPTQVSADCARSMLLSVIIANDCLVRGGDIYLNLVVLDHGEAVAMEIKGPGVRLKDDIAQILSGNSADFGDARCVHALYLSVLVAKNVGQIECLCENDTVKLAFILN